MTVVKCPNCDQLVVVSKNSLEFCCYCNKILVIHGQINIGIQNYDNCSICLQLAKKSIVGTT